MINPESVLSLNLRKKSTCFAVFLTCTCYSTFGGFFFLSTAIFCFVLELGLVCFRLLLCSLVILATH